MEVSRIFGKVEPSYLRDELLHEMFAATVEKFPDKPAIECNGQSLSYRELNEKSTQIASSLQAEGIQPGDIVGIWMERSLQLHAAILGVLKAGASYLPFDQDAPVKRVHSCLEDSCAKLVLLDKSTAAKDEGQLVGAVVYEALLKKAAKGFQPLRVKPSDAAYLIYTSGSTGNPKGVAISHQNVCHYLRAANSIYGIGSTDVVFQGASVAFDLSVEEIFITYLVGAKLFVATRQMLQETDTLAKSLALAGVTVLDTVPTLLSMLEAPVESIKTVILGGEACPAPLVAKWFKPGRKIFNSYGPTETTIVATIGELAEDQAVTIGGPIPNYSCYVVDEKLALVPPGVQGELLIGGPGVALGYVNRPDATKEKFIANPFATNGSLLYRSGDAVSLSPDGNIHFHGRIDSQVKIRGFRVELGEIEALLTTCQEVGQAAVVLRKDNEIEQLVAFLVCKDGRHLADENLLSIKELLKRQLPSYMVPSHFEILSALPLLPAGKVDRKVLKEIPLLMKVKEGQEQPRTATEEILLAVAKEVFRGQPISFEVDFFTELGGHSLLAARFISLVRKHQGLSSLTLQDMYTFRTLRAIAAHAEEGKSRQESAASLAFTPPPLKRRILCGIAQAAVLPFLLSLLTAPWLGVFITYELVAAGTESVVEEMVILLAAYGSITIGTMLFSIVAKWLVIGRTKSGVYPLWGSYYFRWWLASRFVSMIHFKWFQGTPIIRFVLRLLGAKVGDGVILSDLQAGAIDLVTIGDNVTVGDNAHFANAEVIGDKLYIGGITIQDEVYIGTSCILSGDSVVGKGAELADLTALQPGSCVGDWEKWEGSPARRTGQIQPESLPEIAQATKLRKCIQTILYTLVLLLLPPITLLPIIPAFWLFDYLHELYAEVFSVSFMYMLPVLAWPAAMVLIFATVMLAALIRWLVLPQLKPGTYSIYSWLYVRKWIVALTTELTLETLSSLFATIYMRNWYRLLGTKIGKDSEISTSFSGRYDLTEIGEKCFIADVAILGDEDIKRGWMQLVPLTTANRVFVGNNAVVPPGASIPEGALIGIKSRPPADNSQMSPGDIWFGSPPIKLPVRQKFDGSVSDIWTFEPSPLRRLGRALIEAHSVSLPTMLFITFGTLSVAFMEPWIYSHDYAMLFFCFVVASVVVSASLVGASLALKWLLMGVYKPTMQPMWSWWAIRTEVVYGMYWVSSNVILDHLCGTPFLPWILRLYGCKFGEGIFMNTTDVTEFDCVTVGDFSAINGEAALQTHLYEDRLMKVGRVKLGRGVTVGEYTTVLYDTHVGDFAQIGPLSVVMKGEDIPGNTAWSGAPVQKITKLAHSCAAQQEESLTFAVKGDEKWGLPGKI